MGSWSEERQATQRIRGSVKMAPRSSECEGLGSTRLVRGQERRRECWARRRAKAQAQNPKMQDHKHHGTSVALKLSFQTSAIAVYSTP
jgi:hypothetical protein